MANGGGKRKGSRKASRRERPSRPRPRLSPPVVLLAAAVTVAVIAWGYLVFVAIDFGSDARDGDARAWGFLALAAIGAMACLFAGLMLVARLARAVGLTSAPAQTAPSAGAGSDRASGPADAPTHSAARLSAVDSITSARLPRSSSGQSSAASSAATHRHRAD